jgi:hypothetical protein
MKTMLVSAAVTLGVFGLAATTAQAADTMETEMRFAPVELFACTFNDGQDMDDLMDVSKSFNKWLEKNDPGYTYWVLTPRYRETGSEMDFAWIGSWADGASMGGGYDSWVADDGGTGAEFAEVMDCDYSLSSVTEIHVPEGDWPEQSVVWFSRCEREDDVSLADAVGAHRMAGKGMMEAGAPEAASWVFLPGLGFGDVDFDYYQVVSWPTYTGFGSAFDAFFNNGGWKAQTEAMTDTVECQSPNLYDSRLMHAPG